jgi:hypothetical protein
MAMLISLVWTLDVLVGAKWSTGCCAAAAAESVAAESTAAESAAALSESACSSAFRIRFWRPVLAAGGGAGTALVVVSTWEDAARAGALHRK